MGVDRPNYRCRWVRDRLPLLTGGELTGTDRRHVERHLIACPGCRRHEHSMAAALGALHAAASSVPAGAADTPSLWPALARQIRESRHEAPSWANTLARFFRPALVVASGLALVALTASGVDSWVRWRVAGSSRPVAVAAPPLLVDIEEPDPDPVPPPVVPPVVEPPAPGRSVVTNDPPAPPADRFDYDLDHGTPMGPDGLDVKASY